MTENMSISVNGQSQVPPGFRFHPTEEELLHYYLRKKVSFEKIDLDVIRDVDLNKLEPWDIQGASLYLVCFYNIPSDFFLNRERTLITLSSSSSMYIFLHPLQINDI
jgi:hypothetical protein